MFDVSFISCMGGQYFMQMRFVLLNMPFTWLNIGTLLQVHCDRLPAPVLTCPEILE
jgi:hypothetical protein